MSTTTKAIARRMRVNGMSYTEIARKLGVKAQAVARWCTCGRPSIIPKVSQHYQKD